MASESIKVVCLDAFEQVDRERWEALWRRDPRAHIYQKYDWYAAWLRHFAPTARPVILIVHEGERWLGAAALIVRSQAPMPMISRRILTFVSSFSSAYPLYQGPIVDPDHEEKAIEALAGAMAERNGYCALNAELYAADSTAQRLLQAVARATGRPLRQRVAAHTHQIDLPETYDEYIAGLGSKTRRNVRNYSRRFRDAAASRLRVVSGEGELTELLDSMRCQKSLRFEDIGDESNFDQDCFLAFLQDLAPRCLRDGNLTGLAAYLGENVIGTQLIFHDEHGHYFSYNSSFDGEYRNLRVHYLLESERVRLAIDNGYSVVDLSTGFDDHKKHWTAGRVCALHEGEIVMRPLGNLAHGVYTRLKKAVKACRN